MNEFAGKVAFVTGAGSGIGRASALKLVSLGAKVMIMDVDAAGLAETLQLAGVNESIMVTFTGDIADGSTVKKAVADCVTRFGALHLAHNNAGIVGSPAALVADFSPDTFRQVMDVNVIGLFNCLQAELPVMLAAGGGSIVNTASCVGRVVMPEICAYVTSKHAAVGLTKVTAVEYAAKGIRVNCISPGYVITNMTKNFFNEATLQAFVSTHPIGRGAAPEEIADAAMYLLSDRASYITGADLAIDGGYTLQ